MEDYMVMPDGRIVFAVSLAEAASMASVSPKTAWRHAHKGILAAVKRGGKFIVSIPNLRAYVNRNKHRNGDAGE
jgi:hypothetical protein